MNSTARFHYYVEGHCEKKLIRTLIDNKLVIAGKIDVLNPIQEEIKPTHIRSLAPKTTVILVFDTDTAEKSILDKNLRFLLSSPNIKKVITIPQVLNLEQELVKCTDVNQMKDLLNCAHNSDFKSTLIAEKRLFDKLISHQFDIKKLWTSEPDASFRMLGVTNQSCLIKLK